MLLSSTFQVGFDHFDDPSVERILAIKPDLVIVYATQKELIERLDRAKIPYFNYQHKALPDILSTIRSIGARIGSAAKAEALASSMERTLADIRARTAGLPHPATLLVFERDRASLRNVFASIAYREHAKRQRERCRSSPQTPPPPDASPHSGR